MSHLWVLNADRTVDKMDDVVEWSRRFEMDNRVVGSEEIGSTIVSTVFLGIDHNHSHGRPVLFESMVFKGPLDGTMHRWHTYNEAEEGHRRLVERVREAQA